MKKNVGTWDRILRGLAAIVVLVLYLSHQISGGTASLLGIIALVLFLTSTLGFCPCYGRLNISTMKKNKN